MRQNKGLFLLALLLVLPAPAGAGTYYVAASGGGTTWANCTNIATPCTLATANSNAAAGDIVYLRAGTYTITSNGINPTNSGTDGNVITFSGYESEAVTIFGDASISGVSSRGINLSSDSYIKVTKIAFENLYQGFVIHAGGYNEISYCTFAFRDYYTDVYLTGTAEADSAAYLYDTSENLSTYGSKMLLNVTDKSAVLGEASPTTDTIDHYNSRPLTGGATSDLTWQIGDTYKIVSLQSYDPAHCDIGGNSTHNWIHHNTIHGGGALTPQGDEGVLFSIGFTSSDSEENSNNTVEYNHVYHGGHHVFSVNSGFYNVVRNNYFHNEGWYGDSGTYQVCSGGDNGVCGYRVVYSHGGTTHVGRTLYEANVIGYADQYGRHHPASGGPGGGMNVANDDNIIRYNVLVGNVQYGFSGGTSLSAPHKDGEDNRIYNNTFFQNGYNYASYLVGGSDDADTNVDVWRTHILLSDENVSGNALKNNLFHNSWSETNKRSGSLYYPSITAGTAGNVDTNIYANNYVVDTTYVSSASAFTDTDDPLFVSESLPSSSAQIIAAWSNYSVVSPNLSLTVASPAINGAGALTTTNGIGSATTALVVADASYFHDGTWGSSLATIGADWVAVGSVGNVSEISSINYATNTITLASALTWSNGASVWLYKKSDGAATLVGVAPDYGAYEFTGGAATLGSGGAVTLGSGGTVTLQ